MVDGCGNLGKSAYQGKRRRIDQGVSLPSLGSTSNQFAEQFPEGNPLAEPERVLEAPRSTLKDSLHPGDAPRALFLVRFIEDIPTEDLSVELFKDWISSCPAAVAEIRIEASYKCFSTLVFITVPLAMQAYMPKDPAIMALGPVNSSIILHNTLKNTLQQVQEEKTREFNPEKFKATNYAPANSQAWTTPHWTTMDGRQNSFAQPHSFGSNPGQQWTHAPGIVQDMNIPSDDLNSWPGEASQAPTDRLDHPQDDGSSIPQRSPSWSHQATVDDPWTSVSTNVLAEAGFREGDRQNPDSSKIPATVGDSLVSITVATPSTELEPTFNVHNASQSSVAEPWSSRQPHPPKLLGQADAQETEYLPELEWEHLTKFEPLETESRLESFPSSRNASWSLISPTNWGKKLTRDVVSSTDNKSITWVPAESKEEEALLKTQRRGPFEHQKLRGETSYTRKLRACVRCRMQKIRCQINVNDPSGICQTCEAAVSKQRIYTLPCVRHKLTDCVIYRTGKAPGFEFTFRWPKMKLEDITEWSSPEIKNIKVQSDVCDTPLELNVRKFIPIPQDSLRRSWMDGKKKKFKETTPYAIVNMNAAVKVMEDYINKHIFECVAYWLRDKDEWVQETYRFARKYLLIAPSDEAHLLGDTFRLWFAIRRNATTEWIVGGDSLDMVPETKDRSYPLFGKIPLPPVMIQQLDMILNLRFLEPLRRKFLDDLQRIVMRNNPKSWMTIYLITFIACHSFAAVTAENYKNARKHGLLRKYAMPNLMSEIHHSANVCLSHYHYCTSANNPFDVLDKWDKRETTQFAEMSTTEFHFLRKTVKMVKEREDEIKDVHTFGLYEDDLYFVSQMHEKNWTPRDTVIDYREGTVDMC
ncbi:hypothetical protein BKA65DRAFT_500745 [Rhexocercosporidium sp. MPI-PUGE-AT-0058]|nr:hypothetical protein BKA65DRAFT_500745 [Rhexocercosporidium sp. MPI-PUGE-AT-0058]